jgi:hypothetical protein
MNLPTVPRPVLPLPTVWPENTRCIEIDIPDDPQYTAEFLGALQYLAYWFNYDRNYAHDGARTAALWKKAIRSIRACTPCPPPPPPMIGGGFFEDNFMYRQDGCKLQISVGTDPDTGEPCWCTIFDASLCNNPGQPGAPQPQPKPGQCINYTLKLNAAHQALVPTTVSSGDTIALVTANGAGTDGTPFWYCPDGSTFFAGACTGGCSHNPADPLSTYCHMAIIGDVGGTFFPLVSTPYVVPSGVSNQQILLQVNDSTLGDNSGEYVVGVTVCRSNATLDWCATINLALTSGGITASMEDDSTVAGTWSPGVGWRDALFHTGGVARRGIILNLALETFEITGMECFGTYSEGVWLPSPPAFPIEHMEILHPGGDYYDAGTLWGGMVSPYDISGTGGTVPNVIQVTFFLYCGNAGLTDPDPGGTAVLNRLRICGHGPVPSQLVPYLE